MHSWKKTARNTKIENNVLYTELRDVSGKWIQNKVKYNGEDYDNIDGYLVKQDIPTHIYQTHKNFDHIKNDKNLRKCVSSWKKFKNFKYSFYSDEQQDKFMKTHFGNIYDQYASLPLPVMKADLWRYCVIYHYGGIYSDTDTICLSNPEVMIKNGVYLVTPRENTDLLCQWVFAAPKGSPILKKIIDNCVEKIKNGINTKNEHFVHHTTGPTIYSISIGEWLFDNGYPTTSNYSTIKTSEKLFVHDMKFHKKDVLHLFNGDTDWKKQRQKFL